MLNKFLYTLKIIFILIFFIVGCKKKDNTTQLDNSNVRIIKDIEGQNIKIPNDIKKITSISPAITDIIIELGFYDKLVVVDEYSHEVDASIATNDNIVKIDMLNPNIESIINSGSNIVFISTINNNTSHFYLLEKSGITVVNIPTSTRLNEIEDSIMLVSRILNCEDKGKNIVDEMNKSLENIRAIGQTITNKKSLYFELQPPPNPYSFGNGVFMDDVINIIGAENIFKDKKEWIKVSEENIITLNPDIIVILNEHGTSVADNVKKRLGWDNISAIKNDAIYLIPGGWLSRPTHNIVSGVKILAKYVYPDEYKDL